jgi:predicted  nucleic acid-binding Zn-ribbon protein
MMFYRSQFLSVFIIAFSGASCGDDSKLVEKREMQKIEITRLKGELALFEEKLKNLPPDVSMDLKDARQLFEKQAAAVAGLEKEVEDLEAQKQALQSKFDAYRVKYQAK